MIIYQAINKINGKIYIGQTIQKFKDRQRSHINESLKNPKYYFNAAGVNWEQPTNN